MTLASMRPRPSGRGDGPDFGQSGQTRLASMRPRPSGRGDSRLASHTMASNACGFNEAATKRSRRYEGAARLDWLAARFNEAATKRSRRLGREGDRFLFLGRASMRPRPSGRGDPESTQAPAAFCHASMRPRPSGRGDATTHLRSSNGQRTRIELVRLSRIAEYNCENPYAKMGTLYVRLHPIHYMAGVHTDRWARAPRAIPARPHRSRAQPGANDR